MRELMVIEQRLFKGGLLGAVYMVLGGMVRGTPVLSRVVWWEGPASLIPSPTVKRVKEAGIPSPTVKRVEEGTAFPSPTVKRVEGRGSLC